MSTDDAAAVSIEASQRLFDRSELVLVASEAQVAGLADDAARLRVPILVDGLGLAAELARLGATTVAQASGDVLSGPGGTPTVSVDPSNVDAAGLPRVEIAVESPGALLLTDGTAVDAAVDAVVRAGIAAASGAEVAMPGGDPRATSETTATAREHAGQLVLAMGGSFAGERFGPRFAAAATHPELPGGGLLRFDGRLYIAHYGQPGEPVLGVLGERDLDAAVAEVKARAEEYERVTGRTVVPTFEIITTVASGALGDGDYSNEASVDVIRPWVERAGEEGAKQYEELFALPHVGIALASEWRLKPGQKHLEQIGSVTAAEVNEALAWLAELTSSRGLPPKIAIIHQFTPSMVTERETLDTTYDELALLLHVDGHGTPGDKMGTWEHLQEDLPEGIELGWKNFIDEDTPTFTPAQTVAIEPHPVFVSYQ
ncbi:hypothetical protein USB125703_00244 [Pseudoclavibacter triregionum]|nr:hypothetical protein USB125703_00244 [Pseudoclavibacter triregionum]